MLQCLLALRPSFRFPQESEALAESISDLDSAHRSHPSRGELDAQGKPIQGLADLRDRCGGRGLVQPKSRAGCAGPLHEQRDCVGCDAAVERQWRDGQESLVGDPQVFP